MSARRYNVLLLLCYLLAWSLPLLHDCQLAGERACHCDRLVKCHDDMLAGPVVFDDDENSFHHDSANCPICQLSLSGQQVMFTDNAVESVSIVSREPVVSGYLFPHFRILRHCTQPRAP